METEITSTHFQGRYHGLDPAVSLRPARGQYIFSYYTTRATNIFLKNSSVTPQTQKLFLVYRKTL